MRRFRRRDREGGRWEFIGGHYPDGISDICPECGQYRPVKMDDLQRWMCTDCYQVKEVKE